MHWKAIARFWARVDRGADSACWLWVGPVHNRGYGVFHFERSKVLAHRASYEIANGSIPEGSGYHGTVVMHTCDNRMCVNPAHLRLGSQADNVRDMDAKGRRVINATKGIKHWGAKFTEAQVAAIKSDPRGHTEVAQEYGTSPQLVHYIRHKGWADVAGAAKYDTASGKARAGEKNASSKLTDNDIRAIRASTEKPGVVAKRYGVIPDYITSIRKRKTWRHVE